MKTKHAIVTLSFAILAASAAACSSEAPDGEHGAPPEGQTAANAGLDASELFPLPPQLEDLEEAATFDAVAGLETARLSRVLLGGEALAPEGQRADVELWQSPSYRVETSAARGKLTMRVKEEGYAPPLAATLDEAGLRSHSLRLLRDLGLPDSEIGRVHQTRIIKENARERVARTHAHTTIVDRAFHGIRVRGSRAAVVHDLDGSVKHLTVQWPPTAPPGTSGAQWSTRMSPEAIRERAAARLDALGLAHRPATLRYQYVPVDGRSGSEGAVFALKATAFVGVDESRDELQRPVEIDIDLDR